MRTSCTCACQLVPTGVSTNLRTHTAVFLVVVSDNLLNKINQSRPKKEKKKKKKNWKIKCCSLASDWLNHVFNEQKLTSLAFTFCFPNANHVVIP